MVMSSSPAVLRRWIGLELRRLREEAGYERKEVARHLGCALSRIGHLETARNPPRPDDLKQMLSFYGMPERLDFFLDLLDRARRKNWWDGIGDSVVPSWFDLYLGLEEGAARLEAYDALAVPGLLQTPEYAEAIIRGGMLDSLPDTEIRRRVELRMARQSVLTRALDPLHLWAIVDEAVLRRQVGGSDVLRAQLEHLLSAAKRPRLDVQVLPPSVGAHPGLDGSFRIMRFPLEGDPGVVYAETRLGGRYFEEPHQIDEYTRIMNRLRVLALSLEESQAFIASLIEELAP
jgi:transcriptional regulator with XRE-family HTH domain